MRKGTNPLPTRPVPPASALRTEGSTPTRKLAVPCTCPTRDALDAMLCDIFKRRAAVEQALRDMANGKAPLPDAATLHALAQKLGEPTLLRGTGGASPAGVFTFFNSESPHMNFNDLPPLGATLEGGVFAGLTTDKAGAHHAVVLLPARPDKRLGWQAAMDWAAGAGGSLPTRPISALLFANLREQIGTEGWYWNSESHEDDGSYAWGQTFGNGLQDFDPKSDEGRAVAVRLIQLTA